MYMCTFIVCVLHGESTDPLYCVHCCHSCYVATCTFSLTVSTTQNGWTPLVAAAMMGHLDVVKELMKNGASPDTQDPVSG